MQRNVCFVVLRVQASHTHHEWAEDGRAGDLSKCALVDHLPPLLGLVGVHRADDVLPTGIRGSDGHISSLL